MAGLCSQLKIDRIFIADVFYYPELTTRLGDGSYWDLRIDFRRSEPAASPQEPASTSSTMAGRGTGK